MGLYLVLAGCKFFALFGIKCTLSLSLLCVLLFGNILIIESFSYTKETNNGTDKLTHAYK